MALVAAGLGAAPAEAAPVACSKVAFLGLRGSGEPALPQEQNMGKIVFPVYSELADSARSAGMSVLPIGLAGNDEYPAVPVLSFLKESLVSEDLVAGTVTSVVTGVGGLAKRLLPYLGSDRSTCIVLAGYSQGAWVIDNLLASTPAMMSRLTAVVLFGDPQFDGSSDVAVTPEAASQGILRTAGIPAVLRVTGAYYPGMSAKVRSYCGAGDPVCGYTTASNENKTACNPLVPMPWCHHFFYTKNGDVDAAVNFIFDRMKAAAAPASSTFAITSTGTYREGELVYARVNYVDPNEIARGFAFDGIDNNGWGPESHPFTDPSYGRVSPGRVDYPFNLSCGNPDQYESDIRMLIWGDDDIATAPVTIHLACGDISRPG